jgi:MoaA/NifB/PqqE/SkfB family radical SAM enzyme
MVMSFVALARQVLDVARLLPDGGPGACNISVTNACNATCNFCNYAKDKNFVSRRVFIDLGRTLRALDILYTRGIRYLTFTGGEPLLHPCLLDMVAHAVGKGMRPSVVTNGSPLAPTNVERIGRSGLKTVFISIDAPDAAAHERNRGLPGVCARIAEANGDFRRRGIKSVASVTINRLIDDYDRLFAFLRELGFETVTFTYPKRTLQSGSLVFSESSSLIAYSDTELVRELEAILARKERFGILNPAESLREMIRFLKGEKQLFPCYGGHKYFWMTKDFDIYRCDNWPTRLCAVEDFGSMPPIRDDCTRCMSVCYRDSSVLLHTAVAVGDALRSPGQAFDRVFGQPSRLSLRALFDEWQTLKRLSRTG